MKTHDLVKGRIIMHGYHIVDAVDALLEAAELVTDYELEISTKHLNYLYKKMIVFCPDSPLTQKIKGLIVNQK